VLTEEFVLTSSVYGRSIGRDNANTVVNRFRTVYAILIDNIASDNHGLQLASEQFGRLGYHVAIYAATNGASDYWRRLMASIRPAFARESVGPGLADFWDGA
jgi:hypothetical protein